MKLLFVLFLLCSCGEIKQNKKTVQSECVVELSKQGEEYRPTSISDSCSSLSGRKIETLAFKLQSEKEFSFKYILANFEKGKSGVYFDGSDGKNSVELSIQKSIEKQVLSLSDIVFVFSGEVPRVVSLYINEHP